MYYSKVYQVSIDVNARHWRRSGLQSADATVNRTVCIKMENDGGFLSERLSFLARNRDLFTRAWINLVCARKFMAKVFLWVRRSGLGDGTDVDRPIDSPSCAWVWLTVLLFPFFSPPTCPLLQMSLRVDWKDPKTKRLCVSYAQDWVLVVIMALIFYGIDHIQPYHREFSLEDKTLMYTHAPKDTVPMWAVYVSLYICRQWSICILHCLLTFRCMTIDFVPCCSYYFHCYRIPRFSTQRGGFSPWSVGYSAVLPSARF